MKIPSHAEFIDDTPDDLKKKCTRCGEWKILKEEFYTAGFRNNKRRWSSICKECDKTTKRNDYHGEDGRRWSKKREYVRARSRALNRLAKLVPELYDRVLTEEMAKEGIEREPTINGNQFKSVTINTDGTPKKRGNQNTHANE